MTGLVTFGDFLVSCSHDRTLNILEIERDPTAFYFDGTASTIDSLAVS